MGAWHCLNTYHTIAHTILTRLWGCPGLTTTVTISYTMIAIPVQMGQIGFPETKPVHLDPAVNKERRQNSQPGLPTLNPTLSREEHLYLL